MAPEASIAPARSPVPEELRKLLGIRTRLQSRIAAPDRELPERLAKLNPSASARLASRLMEASDRQYWTPDADTLEAMRRAGDELEDRLEGIYEGDNS